MADTHDSDALGKAATQVSAKVAPADAIEGLETKLQREAEAAHRPAVWAGREACPPTAERRRLSFTEPSSSSGIGGRAATGQASWRPEAA